MSRKPMGYLNVGNEEFEVVDVEGRSEIADTNIRIDPLFASENIDFIPLAKIQNALNLSAKNVKVKIDAVQDLHGYDHPWIGGAGKNKFNYEYRSLPYTENGLTISLVNDALNLNGTVLGAEFLFPSSSGQYPFQNYYKDLNPSTSYIFTTGYSSNDITLQVHYKETESGSWILLAQSVGTGTLQFTTPSTYAVIWVRFRFARDVSLSNVKIYPMIRLATESDPTFEPYSNICPINGFDDCEIDVVGKNKINPNTFEQGLLNHSDGSVDESNNWITSDYIKLNGWVSISGFKDGTEANECIRFCEYDVNKNFIKDTQDINTSDNTGYFMMINLSPNTAYVRVTLGFNNKATTPSEFFATNRVQLELGSRPTSYESYIENTYTIDLDGTQYGGQLYVTSGVLTGDMASVDLGSLSWTKRDNAGIFSAYLTDRKYAANLELLCSNYNYGGTVNGYSVMVEKDNGTLCCYYMEGNTGSSIYIYDTDKASMSDAQFTTAMSGVQLVYELAEPITIQLTPTEVQILKNCTVSANTGDISIVTMNVVDAVEKNDDEIIGIQKSLAEIGTIVEGSKSQAIVADTLTTIGSFTLSPGKWIVNGYCGLESSISYTYAFLIGSRTVRCEGNAGGGVVNTLILDISTETEYEVRVYTPANVMVRASWQAIKIA